MRPSPSSPFRQHLHCLKDPRAHNTPPLLHDVLMIALGALISGADSWSQVAEYGRSNLDWFKNFLELPHGLPSHDTFSRFFARIDPQGFHDFFTRRLPWLLRPTESVPAEKKGEPLAQRLPMRGKK